MGQDKLLLAWNDSTVIEAVVANWQSSQTTEVIVVTRHDCREVVERCRRAGATVVQPPEPPAEMRDSVRIGLEEVRLRFSPTDDDVWLLAPADMPRLGTAQIDVVLEHHEMYPDSVIVPVVDEKRGHPVLFPWELASEVATLNHNEGVNAIVARHDVRELSFADAGVLHDLDTPADYDRLRSTDLS